MVDDEEDVEDEVEDDELVVSSPPFIIGRPSPALYLSKISDTSMSFAFAYKLNCI